MRTPPHLTDDHVVAVVHAAGAADPDKVRAGVAQLRALGLRVRHDATFDTPDRYLAGPAPERLAALERAIVDSDVGAIFFARGGYGAMHLLDALPRNLLAEHPTWLVGYSDITALHLWAQSQQIASLHAPMVAGFDRVDSASVDATVAYLRGQNLPELHDLETVSGGRASGRLIGGNLSLLASLIGTRWLPDLSGSIVLIEDIAEALYRVDRMVTSLVIDHRARGLKGVIIGQMTGCAKKYGGESGVVRRIAELLEPLRVPIVAGAPVGHGPVNLPMPLGATVHLDADSGTLAFDPVHETAVATRAARPNVALPAPRARLTGPASLLDQALRNGTCCAAQLDVAVRGRVTHRWSVGVTAVTDDATSVPVTDATRFDLASVTKAVSTAILAMKAVETGLVTLDDRIPVELSVDRPTLRDLLRHTSGLPSYERVFRQARGRDDARAFAEQRFAAMRADAAQVGVGVYSDVGYVALGRWIETLFGAELRDVFAEHVAAPLGLATLGFEDPDAPTEAPEVFAATEYCPFRERTLQGVVHDENTQVLSGACGHAGLFGRAGDVTAVANSLLGYGPALLEPATVDAMWSFDARVDGGTYVLGWDTPSGARSNAGSIMSRDATVGHLGFTGTSLWIDRAREVSIVLLTNRVHPTRHNTRIRDLRPALHDAVMREVIR